MKRRNTSNKDLSNFNFNFNSKSKPDGGQSVASRAGALGFLSAESMP
jgi:hypothetical protein